MSDVRRDHRRPTRQIMIDDLPVHEGGNLSSIHTIGVVDRRYGSLHCWI